MLGIRAKRTALGRHPLHSAGRAGRLVAERLPCLRRILLLRRMLRLLHGLLLRRARHCLAWISLPRSRLLSQHVRVGRALLLLPGLVNALTVCGIRPHGLPGWLHARLLLGNAVLHQEVVLYLGEVLLRAAALSDRGELPRSKPRNLALNGSLTALGDV